MNPQPISNNPNNPSQFPFDHETTAPTPPPEAEPVSQPAPVTPQWHTPAPVRQAAAPVKLDRTSGIAMYLVAVFSGLLAIASASYLISTVLRFFIVDKDNSLMFFDLSSIDLYFLVTTVVFALAYFIGMAMVQKGSSNVQLGFRRRHEIVSALWQSLLALTIAGSIVTFIYSPLDLMLNGTEGDETAGSQLTATILSAVFVLLLSVAMLWRDRMTAKGMNAIAPTMVSALLFLGVIIGGIVLISQPDPKQESLDYSNMMNEQTNEAGAWSGDSDYYDFEATTDEGGSSSSGSWSIDSDTATQNQ